MTNWVGDLLASQSTLKLNKTRRWHNGLNSSALPSWGSGVLQDAISKGDQCRLWNLAAAVGGFDFAANSLETLLQDSSNMTITISVFDL
jgi:hypothetical protein